MTGRIRLPITSMTVITITNVLVLGGDNDFFLRTLLVVHGLFPFLLVVSRLRRVFVEEEFIIHVAITP